ncbi:MAG: hypothetical protein K6G16_06000 [Lachnospiraceae bacterium]|nr:hypothetical protein [Lachnospiraceae bacterium]
MQLTFPSYEFVFFFLPVAVAGFELLRRLTGEHAAAVRRGFLVVCSLLFYLSFGLRNFAVLLIQALCGYLFYLLLPRARFLYGGMILILVGTLACFKYVSPFFPVAVSFTTFSLISFLANARRGEIDDCGFTDYLLYVFFFPKLLQGPIMRYPDFREQEARAAKTALTAERFAGALFLFVLGLSKKVLLADRLAPAVNHAYDAPGDLLWMEALLAAISYSFQIYFDFSGYCDMGRAAARMLGFDLPRNFDRPYCAARISEFWRRWHITLTDFFTRYVYIPLGGSRRGKLRTLANTMIVFLLSGLWHGNTVNFLIWGAMHGVASCLERLLPRPLPLPRPVKQVLTWIFVTLAWIFFRAETVADALLVLRRIFDKPWFKLHDRFISPYLMNEFWYPLKVLGVRDVRTGGIICLWLLLGACALFAFLLPDAERLTDRFAGPADSDRPPHTVGVAVLTAFLFLWCVLSFGEVSSFLYFDF